MQRDIKYPNSEYGVTVVYNQYFILPVDGRYKMEAQTLLKTYQSGYVTRPFSSWYSLNIEPLTFPVAVKVSSSSSTCRVEFGLDGVAALPSA